VRSAFGSVPGTRPVTVRLGKTDEELLATLLQVLGSRGSRHAILLRAVRLGLSELEAEERLMERRAFRHRSV
jgi:hypothetical protein